MSGRDRVDYRTWLSFVVLVLHRGIYIYYANCIFTHFSFLHTKQVLFRTTHSYHNSTNSRYPGSPSPAHCWTFHPTKARHHLCCLREHSVRGSWRCLYIHIYIGLESVRFVQLVLFEERVRFLDPAINLSSVPDNSRCPPPLRCHHVVTAYLL